MFECEFCKKTYSTKSNLNLHKKSTKRCLALRQIVQVEKYKCEYCEYWSENKNNTKKHEIICKHKVKSYETIVKSYEILKKDYENAQKTIEELRKENKEYRDKIFSLATKPVINNTTTRTTNNNTQNLIVSDWRADTIIEKVERGFTLEHLEDGLKGVARFTDEHIIRGEDGKKSLLCTDPARMIFKYKDSEGVVQKDVRATKLKNAIKEPIIKKSKEMFINENSRLFDVINSAEEDENMDFTNAKIDNLRENFLQVKKIDDNSDMYAKELALLTNI